MKIKYLIFLVFISTASALNIDEAINLALQNNNLIKSLDYEAKSSALMVQKSYSNYLPKFDLKYNYNIDNLNAINHKNTIEGSLNFNIFNGLKDSSGTKILRHNAREQDLLLANEKINLALKTKTSYIDALNAKDKLKIRLEAIKLLNEQERRAKNFYKEGLRAKDELLNIKIEVNNAKIQANLATNDLKNKIFNLSNLIKKPINLDLENLENLQLEEVKINDRDFSDFQSLKAKMVSQKTSLKAKKESLNSAKIAIEKAKGDYYPTLDLRANMPFYTSNSKGIINQYLNQYSFSINLKFNLLSPYDAYFSSQIARLKHLNLQEDLQNLQNQLIQDLHLAFIELEKIRDNLALARDNLALAEENYKIVNNRYIKQVTGYKDLLDAEFLLTKSRLNLTTLHYEMTKSIFKLEALIN